MVVTEFDLLTALDCAKRLSDLKAQEIMTHNDVRTLIDVLQTNHFNYIPDIDQENTLVGIVTRHDLARGYLSTAP